MSHISHIFKALMSFESLVWVRSWGHPPLAAGADYPLLKLSSLQCSSTSNVSTQFFNRLRAIALHGSKGHCNICICTVSRVQRKICPAMPRTVACLQGADMVACACRGPIKPPHPPPITTLTSDHTRYSRQRLECKYKYNYKYGYKYRYKCSAADKTASYHDPQNRRQTILPPKGWRKLFWRKFQN